MKPRAVLIATGFFAATMTSAMAHADEQKPEKEFCAALAKVRADFTTLQSIGPSSKMEELRAASDRIATDTNDVQKAASKIKSPTAKQFTESARKLHEEIQALPPGTTVEQAKSKIHGDVQNVQQSAQKLAAESGCPEAAPRQQPPQGSTPPPDGQ